MWYNLWNVHKFPAGPLKYDDDEFEKLFVRTRVYQKMDRYLDSVGDENGVEWIVSPESGYGKSTVLNYAARRLLKELRSLRAFPILVELRKSDNPDLIMFYLQRSVLEWFGKTKYHVNKFARYWKSESQDESEFLRPLFDSMMNKEVDKHLEYKHADLVDATPAEAKEVSRAYKEVIAALEEEIRNGTFKKYVLLLDELDKLPKDDMLNFLRTFQSFFQGIEKHFVTIFTSDRGSFEPLKSGAEMPGGENSYYKVEEWFETDSFMDKDDIRNLVVSRILAYTNIPEKDIPWAEDAYVELGKECRHVPRRIIIRSSTVTKYAIEEKIRSITPNVVRSALDLQGASDVEESLRKRPDLYGSLKEIVSHDAFGVLLVFFNHGASIDKDMDTNPDTRKSVLNVEYTNEEWEAIIRELESRNLVLVFRNHRKLADQVYEFLLELSNKGVSLQTIPHHVMNMRAGVPYPREIEPNYARVLSRIFNTRTGQWLSEQQIFDIFLDDGEVNRYFRQKYNRNPESEARDKFNEEFFSYLLSNPVVLLSGLEFRRTYLVYGSQVIQHLVLMVPDARDEILGLAEKQFYDAGDIPKLEQIVSKAAPYQTSVPPKGRSRSKSKSSSQLQVPSGIRSMLDLFESEVRSNEHPDLINSLLRTIFRDLNKLGTRRVQMPDSRYNDLIRIREFFSQFGGIVQILSLSDDDNCFQFLANIDLARVKLVQVVLERSRYQSVFVDAQSFFETLERIKSRVEIRALPEKSSVEKGSWVLDSSLAFTLSSFSDLRTGFGTVNEGDRSQIAKKFEKTWNASELIYSSPE